MRKRDVPTVGFAHHEDHDDTTATTPSLWNVVPSCRRARRASRRLGVAALGITVVVLSSACVTTTGETVVQRPPLEVPPPPPRLITPLPLPELPPVAEPVEDPGVPTPAAPAKPKPQPNANAAKPDAKPPETPPAEALPPVAPPPVTTPPAPTLSTPPQGDASATQIRESIDRTRRALEKIDYGPLSNLRKKAYDDAKLFATQAEEALKASNLVFAKELADKAERLTKELQGR